MNKIKVFGSLFLFGLNCFNLGIYTASTFKYNQPIDAHRWVLSSFFGLMFLGYFLIEYKNKTKHYETKTF
jgi:hypothetical protein